MLLGLTRLLDALRGNLRADELALMEAHGVATPAEFSRADPPFDVILDEMAGYLGVAVASRCTSCAIVRVRPRAVHQARQVIRPAAAVATPRYPAISSRITSKGGSARENGSGVATPCASMRASSSALLSPRRASRSLVKPSSIL